MTRTLPCPSGECGGDLRGQLMYADEDCTQPVLGPAVTDGDSTWVQFFVECPACETVFEAQTGLEGVGEQEREKPEFEGQTSFKGDFDDGGGA